MSGPFTPPYPPQLMQLRAWNRLTSRDGHEPEATIVTTGMGSGKTECFLYPILDHSTPAAPSLPRRTNQMARKRRA